ncbi:MAG: hypothetical protein CMI96_04380 [Pelagibacteraceae bacterium]|nr:hypothetical protein [Pelagibacteraceae bacterium]|tara:strand:+ start:600 stop:1520 length:921 start_codon:yes stop_codon:yes gene_type:complete
MKFNSSDFYRIQSDASHKKIYRFKNENKRKILIDFSYNRKDYLSFLEIHNFLSMINISVPKIFDNDDSKSIILMEDFGNSRYDKIINNTNPKEILIDAINSLIEIHKTQKSLVNIGLQYYDFSTFKFEITEFVDFYFPYKNISDDLIDEFFYIWKYEFENLNFNWNSFVHKDFELSNLMHLPQRESHLKCGILDFQNAFIGFVGWDVFSLLENPRIYFEDKYNDELIEYFFKKTYQKINFKDFLIQYYFLNTARQTRIIGRWINLDKKNKSKYYSKYLNVTFKRLKKSLFHLQNEKLSKLYNSIIL